jgi:hypothetical protein
MLALVQCMMQGLDTPYPSKYALLSEGNFVDIFSVIA